MKHKFLIMSAFAIIIGGIPIVIIYIDVYRDLPKAVLAYNDSISEYRFKDASGSDINILNILGPSQTLVCYMSPECEACIDALEPLSVISEIFVDDSMNILFMWKDFIPVDRVGKSKLLIYPQIMSAATVLSSTPAFFIVNDLGVVTYASRGNLDTIVDRLYVGSTLENITKRAYKSMVQRYGNDTFLFSSANCEDCIKERQELDEAKVGYSIIDIRDSLGEIYSKVFSINQVPQILKPNGEIVDYFNVL